MLSLLSLLLLIPAALSLTTPPIKIRDSPISVPIAVRINATGSAKLVEADRARARSFVQAAKDKAAKVQAGTLSPDAVIGVSVTNAATTYTASVGVGDPATQYTLLIDTGSSNTWVGAGKKFVHTSTTVQTSDKVAVTYGSGDFSGTEFTDQVTLATGLVIKTQSIGVASQSEGFEGVDGILGIGMSLCPVDLTLDTLTPGANTEIPTVTDNLFSQGTITSHEVGVSFEPTTSASVTNGELTFGGTDSTKFTGSISFTPITSTSPASEFWGINQSIKFGTSTTILSETAGIVDTGTTLVLLASNAFSAYEKATGGVLDENTGLLRLTTAQFAKLDSLFFTIGGTTFELTANAQAWPRSLNTLIGGVAGDVYLIVGDLGTPSGEGLDFINGFTFLERFYSVFDTTNQQVGLATTSFTDATTN
ncbi:aspartic peptidase A1 [Ramaria rubella]|nr:aspartic peptidase A1 [Ramaria rubella]